MVLSFRSVRCKVIAVMFVVVRKLLYIVIRHIGSTCTADTYPCCKYMLCS